MMNKLLLSLVAPAVLALAGTAFAADFVPVRGRFTARLSAALRYTIT